MLTEKTKVSTERLDRLSPKRAALNATLRKMWRMKALYFLAAIPLGMIILFNYVPMYGIFMAFTDYKFAKGILGSDWIGLTYFKQLFNDPLFERAFFNTLRISLKRIFLTFPIPIIFALLINEIKINKFKRVVQSISYMPHFMSWVVVALVVSQVLSPDFGILNGIISMCGGEPIYFQSKSEYFDTILLITSVWKNIGWGSIIYLAAITGVNQELYEAAELDGANRLQKAIYITIPSIMPVIVIQFILTFSSIMNAGFDPIFNLYNGMVMDVADVLDTFSYRIGIEDGSFGYATAIGLFRNVIGLSLVLLVNKITSRISDYGLF